MTQLNVTDLKDEFEDNFDDNEFHLSEIEADESLDFLGLEADDDLDDLFFDLHSGDKSKKDDLSIGEEHHSLPPDWKDFDYG